MRPPCTRKRGEDLSTFPPPTFSPPLCPLRCDMARLQEKGTRLPPRAQAWGGGDPSASLCASKVPTCPSVLEFHAQVYCSESECVCAHVCGVWSASVCMSMERESVSVCDFGRCASCRACPPWAPLHLASVHSPRPSLGTKWAQAEPGPGSCLPALWPRVVSVQFQGPVTWRGGLKNAQGRPWLSRVCWCQGGSSRESVSTLAAGQ